MGPRSESLWLALLGAWLVSRGVTAYYIPGTYPQEFHGKEVLNVHVNSMKSYETDLPFEYYTMPFCKPREGVHSIVSSVNPGTMFQGLRIENSPYNFTMMVEERAKQVCWPQRARPALTEEEATLLRERIEDKYRIGLILDNMPVTTYDLTAEQVVRPGFEIGVEEDGEYFVHNHLIFNVLVHETSGEYSKAKEAMQMYSDPLVLAQSRRLMGAAIIDLGDDATLHPGGVPSDLAARLGRSLSQVEGDDYYGDDLSKHHMYMVVGFEVYPCSIERDPFKIPENRPCPSPNAAGFTVGRQKVEAGAQIVYTYDVLWAPSDIKWASRWDSYLHMPGGRVHWFSLANSALVVLVLAAVVAMILFRTVRLDLAQYESMLAETGSGGADVSAEAGWKLVSGDVFRPPVEGAALCVAVGTGAQVLTSSMVTMLFAVLGFLSPAKRGALLTALILLYCVLTAVGGAAAVALLGKMNGNYAGWRVLCYKVGTYFPGFALLVVTLINLVIGGSGTTGAVPLHYFFSLVALWFAVSTGTTVLGGYGATQLPVVKWPTRTNQIPRHVPPPAHVAASPWALYLAAGVLPFGTLFIEAYFLMESLWQGFFYYLFGYLFLVACLTFIVTAEVALVATYMQLCNEDYHWWWRSFHRGGAVALYVGVLALGFMVTTLHNLHAIAIFVYVAYMLVVCTGLYLAMGAVGFASSLWFVGAIFSGAKSD